LRSFAYVLAGTLLGIGLGWLLAPRMHAPAGDTEELLRARATEYYRASRLLDREAMVRMFTPARQLAETTELRQEAEATRAAAAKLSETERKEAAETAAGIKPGELVVELEGDWAVTGGMYQLVVVGSRITSPLEQLVWVRHGGQWWVYAFTPDERNHYGHPPDFAMQYEQQR
jgi:hypothetical protein